jgi:hypothetical protein
MPSTVTLGLSYYLRRILLIEVCKPCSVRVIVSLLGILHKEIPPNHQQHHDHDGHHHSEHLRAELHHCFHALVLAILGQHGTGNFV